MCILSFCRTHSPMINNQTTAHCKVVFTLITLILIKTKEINIPTDFKCFIIVLCERYMTYALSLCTTSSHDT